MAPRCSWDGLFDSALQLGFVSGRPGQLLDAGSGLKPVLAVHDLLLAGLKPGIDQGYAIAGLRDCDRAHLDRFIRSDDPDESAGGTLLDGRCSNGQSVMPRLKEQPGVDQLARPQQVSCIRKRRPQPDRAGRLHDLVVDEIESAFIELSRVILVVGKNPKRPSFHLLLDGYKARLGKRED